MSVEYPPFFGGGISTYSANLSRALAEAGHEVHVIANAWKGFTGPAAEGPIPGTKGGNGLPSLHVHRIDALSPVYGLRPPHNRPGDMKCIHNEWGLSLYWSILAADELQKLHARHPFDLVEFPECFADGYVSLRRRALGVGIDVPMTVTLHSPTYKVHRHNLQTRHQRWFHFREAMEVYGIREADMLCSPSQSLACEVTRDLGLGPETHPIHIIPNPMDFASAAPAPAAPAGSSPSLLFVGRIEPRKGVKDLVDAAVAVMTQRPSLTLHLIGRDGAAGEAAGLMSQFLLRRIPPGLRRRVFFEGILPRERVLERYATATACVFPAPWDNFPYACCEAMSQGACVIASDQGGMSEMIEHERSGTLFKAGDAADLARAIQRALDEPELSRRVRAAAPLRVRGLCEASVVVPQRIAFFQQAVEKHRRRRGPDAPPDRNRITVNDRSATVCVLVRPADDPTEYDGLLSTIDSVRRSAAAAGLNADISVLKHSSGTNGRAGPRLPNGINIIAAVDEPAAISNWLGGARDVMAEYLLMLESGEMLDDSYCSVTAGMLKADDRTAWATTWARSDGVAPAKCFAGLDFTIPQALVDYRPVPFALIRTKAFDEVGGWDVRLPRGWRDWDLWLALAQAGWAGKVAPLWLATCNRRSAMPLPVHDDPMEFELTLDRMTARNHELFAQYGLAMWRSVLANTPEKTRILGPQGALALLARTVTDAVSRRSRRLRRRLRRS